MGATSIAANRKWWKPVCRSLMKRTREMAIPTS